MRKNKLVAIILLAAFITVLSFYLYSSKKVRIDLSGGKMIASDDKGPYEDGVDGVQTYSTKIFNRDVFVIQMGSRRSVWIYFSDAHWMNESMGSMPPRFQSRQYIVDFTIYVVPSAMEIGERQSPIVQITLYDPDARFDSVNLPSPYGQNRLEMVRASQDKWTLDVDAWFMGYDLPITQSPFPTYYVRISFTMTMQAVPSYIFTGYITDSEWITLNDLRWTMQFDVFL